MSNEQMGNQNPHPWSREGWSGQSARPEGPSYPTSSPSGPVFQPSAPPVGQQGQPQSDPSRGPWQQPRPEQYGPQRPSQPQPGGSWYDAPPQYRPAPQPATTQKPAKRRTGLAGMLAVAVLAGGIGGGTGVTVTKMLEDQPTATATTTSAGPQGTTTEVVQADPANPNWTVVAEAAADSVVAIQVMGNGSGGQGSGVVIDNEGHIVTNNHVIAGSGQGATITVLLGTTSYEAEVVGTDPSTDLAVIKFVDPPAELSVMSYGDVDTLNVGDPVMAIGNPLGLADTVTTGIISALDRPVTTRAVGNTTMAQGDDVVVTAAIQTNAAINPGNSGGALVNGSGELIGITSSIAALPSAGSAQAGNIGIGFAIGADQVKYVADQLIETGVAKHPRIGVSASDIRTTGQVGAEVATVVDGSPAAEAGIQVGDLITAVDGKPVMNMESLVALVRAGQVGQEMKITVQRGGQEQELTVIPIAASR
jgi:putative serine protease PepD